LILKLFVNSSSVYSCPNVSNVNYNPQQNELMNVDLYGLSMSPSSSSIPPSTTTTVTTANPTSTVGSCSPSSLIDPSTNSNRSDLVSLSSSVDNLTKQSNSPVIYPWMRKVHMNNPGKNQSKSRKVNEIRLMIKRDRCLSNSSRTIK